MDEKLIPLTVPEVRRLLYRLIWRHQPTDESVLRWSRWRRRHQATAGAAITDAARNSSPHFCNCSTRLMTEAEYEG